MALLVAAGLHSGLAAGTRLGLDDAGLELMGGYQLLYAFWQREIDWERERGVESASSAQFGAEAYATPWHPRERSAIGVKGGYRYNTVLHHGFAAAITFLTSLSDHLALEGLAGAQVFPGAEGRLRREVGVPRDASIVYGSQLQLYELGFELIWFPWSQR